MSIANVYEKLKNGITECEQGATAAETERVRLIGMAQGFKLALRVLADEGLTPEPESTNPNILPFK